MAKVSKKGVKCFVHPITLGQYKRMEEKGLDAFKTAPLSSRAKNEGAREWGNGNGIYITPSQYITWDPIDQKDEVHKETVYCVSGVGNIRRTYIPNDDEGIYGLRISLHPLYKPRSKIVKTAGLFSRRAEIYDSERETTESIVSTGTVVTVGGIEYLWLNKNECENGTEFAMDLVSVELVARAESFPRKGRNTDYAKAKAIQKQCNTIALENCDDEEIALLQEGILLREDNYKNWTPLEMQKAKPNSVKDVYKLIEAGEMTVEEGKQALQEILDDIKLNGEAEELEGFTHDLEKEHKAYEERIKEQSKADLQRQEEEKAAQDATQKAYDTAKATIDELKFGDDQ